MAETLFPALLPATVTVVGDAHQPAVHLPQEELVAGIVRVEPKVRIADDLVRGPPVRRRGRVETILSSPDSARQVGEQLVFVFLFVHGSCGGLERK